MKHRFTLLAALAAFAVASPALAQEGTLKKVKDSGAITVGHRDASVPFSYYDDKQQPVGYSMDLCARVVDAVKRELKLPNLKVNYQLVTSANRIPLMANGTIDLECGSTGIMLRKDDAAFKKVVNGAINGLYKSGEISKIYDKWFQKPIPPKNINLNLPMSAQFKNVVANPTDSGDPNAYK